MIGDNVRELKEQEEKAQIIIDSAVQRLREMGFGVVADGTVHGDGIWIDRLRVVHREG